MKRTEVKITQDGGTFTTAPEKLGDYAAVQPCSGTRLVTAAAFGGGAGAATPAFVCAVNKPAA